MLTVKDNPIFSLFDLCSYNIENFKNEWVQIKTSNQTYIKQDGRQPPAYFPPSNFVKDAFWKDENFFSTKSLLSNFLIFPILFFLAKSGKLIFEE